MADMMNMMPNSSSPPSGSTTNAVVPGTTMGNRYSMGPTGSVIDNGGSSIAPQTYTMPGGEASQAQNQYNQQQQNVTNQMRSTNPTPDNSSGYAAPSGYMPSNPSNYGR